MSSVLVSMALIESGYAEKGVLSVIAPAFFAFMEFFRSFFSLRMT